MNEETSVNVDIDNIGPIEHLTIPVKPGTITVLRGPNGSGKSQALNAVGKVVSGKGSLTSRDGTTGGTASGMGVQVKVGRSGKNSRKITDDELQVEALEDSLNIADLVDPGLKDQAAADDRRIKALISLAGVDPDIELFIPLVAELDVPGCETLLDEVESDSLVEMAAKIKRLLEKQARDFEEIADKANQNCQTLRKQNEDIDLSAECDAEKLEKAYLDALNEHSKVTERLESRSEQAERHATAMKSLEKAKADYKGPTLHKAQKELALSEERVLERKDEVNELRKKLAAAEKELEAAESVVDIRREQAENAQRHESLIASWEETIANGFEPDETLEQQLADASEAVDAAREAQQNGSSVRDAKDREVEATASEGESKQATQDAKKLRDAAAKTNSVLTKVVSGMAGPFSVNSDMRLVVKHAKRGECFYSDLSHGERWKLGLDVAIEAFKRKEQRGLLCIPQEAFESLDGNNRKIILGHISGTDLAIITAEASRDDLEELQTETVEA